MQTIDNLMKELGLESLPEEKKIGLLSSMTESVLKRITVEALSRLSDEDQKRLFAFQKNTANPEEVEAFLKETVPDYEKIQEDAVADFKEEMKSTMAVLQAA